ncbi:hypothetical protein [Hyphomonas oceanitis]|uniref:Uncharacterized protein n=1 Tax=Hyphomonas oceanitis SCH89 TaxID=1280953 RepID=A0A059GBV7_9PROT|nr:hypothetical protein [Hyphomonas oceanitis]KDA04224.1 hypothetical protein HOC_00025 [Hyphomonas oceanitis SCH89]
MTHEAVEAAVRDICREDRMPSDYEARLGALIANAMRNNLDKSDIEDVLRLIPTDEAGHED